MQNDNDHPSMKSEPLKNLPLHSTICRRGPNGSDYLPLSRDTHSSEISIRREAKLTTGNTCLPVIKATVAH